MKLGPSWPADRVGKNRGPRSPDNSQRSRLYCAALGASMDQLDDWSHWQRGSLPQRQGSAVPDRGVVDGWSFWGRRRIHLWAILPTGRSGKSDLTGCKVKEKEMSKCHHTALSLAAELSTSNAPARMPSWCCARGHVVVSAVCQS